jgi:hypothetical protein
MKSNRMMFLQATTVFDRDILTEVIEEVRTFYLKKNT